MTVQETIDMAFGQDSLVSTDLAPYVANDLSAMTSAQKVSLVNWALRVIGRKVKMFHPSIAFTPVVDVDVYSLRDTARFAKGIVVPVAVIVNGEPLLSADARGPGMWSLDELEARNRTWRTQASGTPSLAVHVDSLLILYPKPTQAVIDAGGSFVAGECLPAPASTGNLGDQLDLVEDLHEAVAFLAAVKAALGTVDEGAAWKRLEAFNAEVADVVREVAQRNANTRTSWGTTQGDGVDRLWL